MGPVNCQWLLQLVGTGLALWALVDTFVAYSGGKGFWYPVTQALHRVAVLLLDGLIDRSGHAGDRVHGHDDAVPVSRYERVSTRVPVEDQVKHLDAQFQVMVKELNALRKDVVGDRRRMRSVLGDTARATQDQITNLAVGTIRRQMIGLILIGAGTVCSAVPAIWCT